MTEKNYTFTISEKKDFDIKLLFPCEVVITANNSDKVEIIFASEKLSNLEEYIKIKTSNTSHRFDVKIKAVDLEENINIIVSLPSEFVNKVEFSGNIDKLLISNIKADNIETDGKISVVEIQNVDSHIELNSNIDMNILCSNTIGKLDINQLSANSRLALSADTKFIVENKGRKTQIIINDNLKSSDDFELTIELNGMKSNLTIIKA